MKPKILLPFLLIFLTGIAAIDAQAQRALQAEELERYRNDTESLVSFLEFTFNTIGSKEIPVREKDIIINQSFSKFFENEKVQIEDDLDENREVPINKDVQAYLKDIDFFFREVQFIFTIQEIEHQINDRNQVFFKVTLNRNLSGITVSGDTVNNNRLRYIEINLDGEAQDLKIASIYTTKLNEKEELRKWWNELPPVWKNVFGESIVLQDTIRLSDVVWYNDSLAKLNYLIQWRMSRDTLTFAAQDSLYLSLSDSLHISAGFIDRQLKRITSLDTLDISGNSQIISLEPLSRLSDLRRLNCSHTLVNDLMPLRNMSKLRHLDCSHTAVASLSSLKYSTSLQTLDISYSLISDIGPAMNFTALGSFYLNHTAIDSITALSELTQLKDLEIAGTKVTDISPVREIKSIERIDVSETQISDLSPLSGLTGIYLIKFENTPVSDLTPLKNLDNLIYIFADHSLISDLSPLDGLPLLNRVYCDKTGVTRQKALNFMQNNTQVLVIYESADLEAWWNGLTPEWRRVFIHTAGLTGNPEKEELHQIIRIKEINIAGNQQIQDLKPLSNLPMLAQLNAQRSGITSLEPLTSLADLREINFSETKVMSVAPLGNLPKIEKILMDNTLVTTLQPLNDRESLRYIYCDITPVSHREVLKVMELLPQCLIIYQTGLLQSWWGDLPDIWKSLADEFLVAGQEPGREQLQQFVNMKKLNLTNAPGIEGRSLEFKDLDNIEKFVLLEELHFTNTSITSLEPLRGMNTLRALNCPNNPVESLEPLSEVRNLQTLNVQSTPVSNLEFLSGLTNLKQLNISGTLIRNLKGLEYLENIEQLDAYNTSIRRLNELENLQNLKLVRVYNTRISQRHIGKFREQRPQVEVVYY
jgi:hypothetical protein